MTETSTVEEQSSKLDNYTEFNSNEVSEEIEKSKRDSWSDLIRRYKLQLEADFKENSWNKIAVWFFASLSVSMAFITFYTGNAEIAGNINSIGTMVAIGLAAFDKISEISIVTIIAASAFGVYFIFPPAILLFPISILSFVFDYYIYKFIDGLVN